MKYYFAPLEGITGYTFRNLHHAMFPGMDRYYAPFIMPKQTHQFSPKELRDVSPENQAGLKLIPQIMANSADNFIWAAEELKKIGYDNINLNLGCPMPTIVTRRKGSGMLADLTALKIFLDQIFDAAEKIGFHISIKTRLGVNDFNDAGRLMEIYNAYPLADLIIHPRCQKDLYKNRVNFDAFDACLQVTSHRICYNGDIFSREDYAAFIERFGGYEQIEGVMLARGIIANPALCREIVGGSALTIDELHCFERAIYEAYMAQNPDLSVVLHRMKELWFYWGGLFHENEKQVHKIRISKTIEEYLPRVNALFDLFA